MDNKKLLMIGGGVVVIGTIVYFVTKPKKTPEPFKAIPPVKTNDAVVNQQQPFQQNQIVFSQQNYSWYPKWLPPITISI